ARTATRTRSCPAAGPVEPHKRRWTVPAGSTLATRLPGPSIDPDPARTYKPDHLALSASGASFSAAPILSQLSPSVSRSFTTCAASFSRSLSVVPPLLAGLGCALPPVVADTRPLPWPVAAVWAGLAARGLRGAGLASVPLGSGGSTARTT